MTSKNNFPIIETILAVLAVLFAAFIFFMMRQRSKEKQIVISKIRDIIANKAGIDFQNDLTSKLLTVKPDTSFAGKAGVKKLLSYVGYTHNNNGDIINYIQSLNLSQIKALDIAFSNNEGKTLDEWLQSVLNGFTSNCGLYFMGCGDYEKATNIIKSK